MLFYVIRMELWKTLLKAYPMTAKAGSSWRSNGKSNRKRVLKRAVMVSVEKEKVQQELGNRASPYHIKQSSQS